jgi:maltooligosyltrehalose trehalohydrolase
VLVDDRPPLALQRDEGGFWRAWCDAQPGADYWFEVDGLRVPDPASRFQPRDVGGPSRVVDSGGYVWRYPDWRGRPWEEAVFYEVHVGTLGGYDGVRARLPALAELGITALELMPIADFSGARNWGYDGVLPYAPDSAYGPPDALRALIDAAHGHGMMVFLDVVYNHFGPEGNWLPEYAGAFFDAGSQTPWGAAIDFHNPVVRRFFTENALYWLDEFRFDGLRLDAVHAIIDQGWLLEMAATVRRSLAGRHVHLVLENEANSAAPLQAGFNAQWNDDFHNVMHVLLTGEAHAYYGDFAAAPAEKLARCLAEGFIYQGDPSPHHEGAPRGEASAHLPPTAFVSFLQNHDQVGNRAYGERLTGLARPEALRAAMVLLLLCPQIPLLFMGEEAGAREPFLFFTDFHGGLADAVREGRRREFARLPGFDDAAARAHIPDPNAPESFAASQWSENAPDAGAWRALVGGLLALRHRCLVKRLRGARAIGADAISGACVRAAWRLGDGAVLTIAVNLGDMAVNAALPAEPPLFGDRVQPDQVPAFTTLVWLAETV